MSPSAAGAVTLALAEVVGMEHVLSGGRTAAFAVDGRVPTWVIFPGSVDEVSRCLAVAATRSLSVVPTGRGARLGWGSIPRGIDVVLSLRRLDRILDYEPADLTISVQAGMTLPALNGHLRGYRQFLPLDPARASESTVGGLIATAASGPYRARYGTMRDLILGLTVVQADGTSVKGGGRVVKNVTGYDMPKLHVGALGTLGVIVEAHLRLHPLPAAEATWLFGFPSAEAALDGALGIRDTPTVVSRLELVDGATLGHPTPPAAALAVTIGSVFEAVRTQGRCVVEVCRGAGGRLMPLASAGTWWSQVSEATWPVDDVSHLTLRIGSRPTDVVKALRAVEAAASSAGVALRATAEVANGVLHVALTGAGVSGAVALLARIRGDLASLDATCVVEHAPPSVKGSVDVWGDVGPALAVMQRLKAEFDPQGVLNPGRFVGGI